LSTERIDEKSISVIVQSMEAIVFCLLFEPAPMKASRSGPGSSSGHCSAGYLW
jgi:hypothetical protein